MSLQFALVRQATQVIVPLRQNGVAGVVAQALSDVQEDIVEAA